MEGGSKRRIEEEWTLDDYREIMVVWKQTPPPHIVLSLIARSLGIDFGGQNNQADPDASAMDEATEPVGGMSILEMSMAIKQPVPGGETLQSSLEALKLMGM